jgi:hypothetical protein
MKGDGGPDLSCDKERDGDQDQTSSSDLVYDSTSKELGIRHSYSQSARRLPTKVTKDTGANLQHTGRYLRKESALQLQRSRSPTSQTVYPSSTTESCNP